MNDEPTLQQVRDVPTSVLPKPPMSFASCWAAAWTIVPGRSPVAASLRPNANFRRLWSSYAGSPHANAMRAAKFSAVFSQRRAMRLKRLSLPTACSMRARPL